ncbi:hypothetical protein [Rhodococcus sp. OK302]|nr:hypothetical protein [Rhodococcus sp. OK302]
MGEDARAGALEDVGFGDSDEVLELLEYQLLGQLKDRSRCRVG